MPDRTPAEELTAAADKLDALLADVYPLPWYEAPVRLVPHRGIFDAKNREIATAYERSEVPRVSALTVALVNAGPALVALLRSKALHAPPRDQRPLLDLARAILGSADAAPVRGGGE